VEHPRQVGESAAIEPLHAPARNESETFPPFQASNIAYAGRATFRA
jgi:hypothetical protein